MSQTSDRSTRPLRRDAARNRRLLLDAGREVFATRGLDATLDDVARHAGVGVGTAYRHFANKQELAAAIFSDDFDKLIQSARDALAADDPWEGLVGFLETTAARQANDRGLYELLTARGATEAPPEAPAAKAAELREALVVPLTELVERAKARGCVRADCAPTDLGAILVMLGNAYAMSEATGRPIWHRYLWLLLDGLRATDRPPLPGAPLEPGEFDNAMAAAKHPH
ncbi:TetR/AcrR family transcriptional regulator [Gryllotalpicola ginsengisoli]|uniref:TetR/AcrR family transcriptional regulator n=1 Tax=Gryllotalpicola ginsengisoli TaxID=444608 RepID=UPI0003B3FA7E|nr:TetR/AcrR family transcriptional regulator [Gryllotalpicola ginsengisoli]